MLTTELDIPTTEHLLGQLRSINVIEDAQQQSQIHSLLSTTMARIVELTQHHARALASHSPDTCTEASIHTEEIQMLIEAVAEVEDTLCDYERLLAVNKLS